jgi:hypothetical protein
VVVQVQAKHRPLRHTTATRLDRAATTCLTALCVVLVHLVDVVPEQGQVSAVMKLGACALILTAGVLTGAAIVRYGRLTRSGLALIVGI